MKTLPALVMLSGVAHAEPVNLLARGPATVAVSSTVDSTTYLPEHLVDGDLATAWNSLPGDLNAWIAFRVPDNAHVSTIKLTVGFTARDWFTQNLRISKLRIAHAGKDTVVSLDPKSKALQSITVDGGGGTYFLTVSSTVPGTNKDWNEIVVSELEVWGTLPAGVAATAVQHPRVIVGSLDVDCIHALWPKAKGGRVTATEGVRSVTVEDSLCIVDRGKAKSASHVSTVALMRGDAVADKLELSFPNDPDGDSHVTVEDFTLGSERALLVTSETAHSGEMTSSVQADHTLYRIASGKLVAVTSYATSGQAVEQFGESHECKLTIGAATKPMPELVLTCEDMKSDAEGTPAPKQTSVTKLHWKSTKYE